MYGVSVNNLFGPQGFSPYSGFQSYVQQMTQALTAVDQVPVNQLQSQIQDLQGQYTDWTNLAGDFSALQTAAQQLASSSFWTTQSATSSNSSAVTATVAGSIASGAYNVTVSALAVGEVDISTLSGATSSGAVATASGNFEIGLAANATASGTPATYYTVSVASGSSLDQIAQDINATASGAVTASVVDTTNGYELMVQAGATGQAVMYNAVDSGGLTDLQGLGLLASTDTTGTWYGSNSVSQKAQDAAFTVDGAGFTSNSNANVTSFPGLNLNFYSTTSGTTITVSTDTAAIQNGIQQFVNAYNQVVTDVNTQTQKLSGDTISTDGTGTILDSKGNPLIGPNATLQSTLMGLQQTLFPLTAVTSGLTMADFVTVNAGQNVSAQQQGTLTLNTTALSGYLQNDLSQVQSVFTNSGGTGLAQMVQSQMQWFTGPGGSVDSAEQANKNQQQFLQNQLTTMQQVLQMQQQTLAQEFYAMEQTLGSTQMQDLYLQAMLGGGAAGQTQGSSGG